MTEMVQAKVGNRRPQILSGFRDHLPAQMIRRRRIIEIFRQIFERHGFEPIDTPAIEHLEVLTGKAGENEKLMYQWEDHGGRWVGLRYDLTVPLARFIASHESEIVVPFKRYHISPVWRAEKPQRGRFREFWQCDADIVGSTSMLADAEAISIAAEALTSVGLANFVIQISHRRLLEAIALASGVREDFASSVFRSIDKLAKIGATGVSAELRSAGVDELAVARLLEAVTETGSNEQLIESLRGRLEPIPAGRDALRELSELFQILPVLGIAAGRYKLDASLARGLDYYTGPVYEALVDEPKVGSVVGAGRYDGLIGNFLGRPIPATGMSLGLERIIEVVEEFDLLPTPPSVAFAMVVVQPDSIATSAEIARELRMAGLNIDLSLQPRKSPGDQLKYAARRKIPFAVIQGEAERAQGLASIKDLVSGKQWNVRLDRLASELAELQGARQ